MRQQRRSSDCVSRKATCLVISSALAPVLIACPDRFQMYPTKVFQYNDVKDEFQLRPQVSTVVNFEEI